MIPKARAKSRETAEWVVGYGAKDYIFNPVIFVYKDTKFHAVAVDPETVCLKVPFINIFTDDIVTVNGVRRGRVKFGGYHVGDEDGMEFNVYGFYVEVFNADGTTTQYAINEHGFKFEVF